MGSDVVWILYPSLFEILYCTSSLDISCFEVFPITLFSPCLSLTTLVLSYISNDSTDGLSGKLVGAKLSNGRPVLDFLNLRSLSDRVEQDSELAVVRALLKATDKLETLEFIGMSHYHDYPF